MKRQYRKILCRHCEAELKVPAEATGTSGPCPRCSGLLIIPTADEDRAFRAEMPARREREKAEKAGQKARRATHKAELRAQKQKRTAAFQGQNQKRQEPEREKRRVYTEAERKRQEAERERTSKQKLACPKCGASEIKTAM